MSGPIIRKYGFPNHEQIFGRRPPEHGVDEPRKEQEKDDAKPRSEPKAEERKADQRGG